MYWTGICFVPRGDGFTDFHIWLRCHTKPVLTAATERNAMRSTTAASTANAGRACVHTH